MPNANDFHGDTIFGIAIIAPNAPESGSLRYEAYLWIPMLAFNIYSFILRVSKACTQTTQQLPSLGQNITYQLFQYIVATIMLQALNNQFYNICYVTLFYIDVTVD